MAAKRKPKKNRANHLRDVSAKQVAAQRPKRRPTDPGEAWRHCEQLPDGNMRVRFEYITFADASEELNAELVTNVFGAARNTDLKLLARQHPERVQRGTMLTRDGTFLAEAWIEQGETLLVLKGRPSNLDDLATHDVYLEPAEATEDRKAEARRRIEEQQAKASGAAPAAHPTLALPDKRIVGVDGKPLSGG